MTIWLLLQTVAMSALIGLGIAQLINAAVRAVGRVRCVRFAS